MSQCEVGVEGTDNRSINITAHSPIPRFEWHVPTAFLDLEHAYTYFILQPTNVYWLSMLGTSGNRMGNLQAFSNIFVNCILARCPNQVHLEYLLTIMMLFLLVKCADFKHVKSQ